MFADNVPPPDLGDETEDEQEEQRLEHIQGRHRDHQQKEGSESIYQDHDREKRDVIYEKHGRESREGINLEHEQKKIMVDKQVNISNNLSKDQHIVKLDFKCDQCEQIFTKKRNLQRHVESKVSYRINLFWKRLH